MNKITLSLVAVVVIAAAASYSFGIRKVARESVSSEQTHASALEPAPAPMIGATSSQDGLLPAPSPTSRAEAATALQQAELCLLADKAKRFLAEQPEQADVLRSRAGSTSTSEEERRETEQILFRLGEMISAIEKSRGTCPDVSAEVTRDQVYAAAERAANLGDARAASCYVSRSYEMSPSMESDAKARAAYAATARRLIDAGIRSGSWIMTTLALSAENGLERGWIRAVGSTDASTGAEIRLRLLTLQSLGAPDADMKAQYLVMADSQKQFLTPQATARGEAWARTTYAKSFSRTNAFDPNAPFCP